MDWENSEFSFLEQQFDSKVTTPQDNFISVSEFIHSASDLLAANFADVVIIGEVSSYKESQGKWVFFDLKDEENDKCSVNCFIPIWQLHMQLEDGMKVKIKGSPKLTEWGKFSFTVSQIMPVGEGSIKKNFELLKKKLTAEGLFDESRKRALPKLISTIGVVSSIQAAGYADFIKILGERWGGLKIKVCHTQVQGLNAPAQMIRAIKYLNEKSECDVIVVIRGGGSADDLSAFNDEELVRVIAASKIPVLTGIGHEVDTSLADLAADIVASTPSNAAQMLTPDKRQLILTIRNDIIKTHDVTINKISETMSSISDVEHIRDKILTNIENCKEKISNLDHVRSKIISSAELLCNQIKNQLRVLESVNPENVLKKGYAIIHGDFDVGKNVEIELEKKVLEAEIKQVKVKSKSKS